MHSVVCSCPPLGILSTDAKALVCVSARAAFALVRLSSNKIINYLVFNVNC
jgi:hypothetical protein